MRSPFLLVLLVASGCASHIPMSGTALLRPTGDGSAGGFGVTVFGASTADRDNPSVQVSACDLEPFNPSPDCSSAPDVALEVRNRYNPNGIGGGLYLTTGSDRVALSVTLGIPVAGVDASIRIAEPLVLTAAYSGGERGSFGATFGTPLTDELFASAALEYRRRGFTYEEPLGSDSQLAFEPFTIYSDEVSLRLSTLLRNDPDRRSGVLVHVSVGYDPALGGSSFGAGFALGR